VVDGGLGGGREGYLVAVIYHGEVSEDSDGPVPGSLSRPAG
jgi:hypothetical protein